MGKVVKCCLEKHPESVDLEILNLVKSIYFRFICFYVLLKRYHEIEISRYEVIHFKVPKMVLVYLWLQVKN